VVDSAGVDGVGVLVADASTDVVDAVISGVVVCNDDNVTVLWLIGLAVDVSSLENVESVDVLSESQFDTANDGSPGLGIFSDSGAVSLVLFPFQVGIDAISVVSMETGRLLGLAAPMTFGEPPGVG
jgi:hypothetical protein